MKVVINPQKIKEVLNRGVSEVIVKSHLQKKLLSGKRLRVKLGIDPTGPQLHLGRAAQLLKLKEFQDLGHQVVIIIGDFTARIGDASDKQSMRKPLTAVEVKRNMRDYKTQIGKILDVKKAEFHYNSEWFSKLKLSDIISLAMHFTAQQVIQRRNFKERWEKGKPIGIHELLYPLLQGYDSMEIKADVEVGGTDQLFNMKVGREIQNMFHQPPQDIMVLKMLYGLDGRKMSTTWGNVVNITDKPNQMYGKIMSMRDELIGDYFELSTKLPLEEVQKIRNALQQKEVNPRDLKAKLAQAIVALYYGKEKAKAAQEEFNKVFREKKLPAAIPTFKTEKEVYPLLELLCDAGLAVSKSNARRLVLQKGVRISGKIVTDWRQKVKIKKGLILQVGKRRFVKIIR